MWKWWHFYLFICKKSWWTYPLFLLGVILWCSNNLVFNSSLTAAWEATEKLVSLLTSRAGRVHIWVWLLLTTFEKFHCSRSSAKKYKETKSPLHNALVWMSWTREARQKYCLYYTWWTQTPWAPLILDQQGWRRYVSSKNRNPKSNYSQSSL